jgi:chondroitin AC lyase
MNPVLKLFIIVFTLLIAVSNFAKADDFELIKRRVSNQLMGTGIDDESIANIIDIMNEDGSYQGINYDDLSREAGFPHGRHTSNLFQLARAYNSKSSRYYHDENIINLIIRDLSTG